MKKSTIVTHVLQLNPVVLFFVEFTANFLLGLRFNSYTDDVSIILNTFFNHCSCTQEANFTILRGTELLESTEPFAIMYNL